MHKRYQHPELRGEEVFWVNVEVKSFFNGLVLFSSGFRNIDWRTKRLGGTAYDHKDNVLKTMRPVFVQRSELEKAGIALDSVGSIVESYYS